MQEREYYSTVWMEYYYMKASELATDEHFIAWVQQPTAAHNAYWENFLQQHPERRQAVQEARELVSALSHDADVVEEWELNELWQGLDERRQQYLRLGDEHADDEEDNVVPVSLWQRRPLWVAAAVTAILLVSGVLLWQRMPQPTVQYATRSGERMRLLLPDSSSVVLNSNSTLTVPKNWSVDEDRMVQLEGQAYFSITHKHNNQRFVVQTGNGLDVEVLGTEFSVTNKGNRQQVILESGKVNLSIARNGKEQELRMVPGDLVEASMAGISKKQVQTKLYTAWKNINLDFENNTLGEIAQLLQHSYGYTVHIPDAGLREQRISASLNVNSPEHILSTLSETLQVRVTQQNTHITISSN